MKQEGDIGKINKYMNYLLPNKFKKDWSSSFMYYIISYFAIGVYVEIVTIIYFKIYHGCAILVCS
jgi:hypothetical protein